MVWYDKYVKIVRDKMYVDFLRGVYTQAWKFSDDESIKTGVLLIDKDLNILVKQNNHFPFGTDKISESLEGSKKYEINNHAERATIYEAAKKGIRTDRLTMVMPWAPCLSCANAIIFSGIDSLICRKQMVNQTLED